MKFPPDDDTLFSRVCDGLATREEIDELHRRFVADPGALDAWLHYCGLHGDLATGDLFGARDLHLPGVQPIRATMDGQVATSRRREWWQWMPQVAAGLVFGLFTATIVWAYVAPRPLRVVPLMTEDFERASTPLATRVALEPGVWRGDYAEVVGAQQGVRPANGEKMLRFLRADFEGRAKPNGGHISDVYRLIDLGPYLSEFADGGAVVQVSASFNATEFPADEKYGCAISVYAVDAESLPERAERIGSALTTDSIAMARSSRTKLDRDPATWQRLATELRLPANAEYLVIRLHVSQAFDSTGKAAFSGGYADDVRVVLTRRSPVP